MATAADMDNVNCSEPLVGQNDCITPVESQPEDMCVKPEFNKSTTPSSTTTNENTSGGSKARYESGECIQQLRFWRTPWPCLYS